MSAVAVVRYLLANNSPLIAVVPATKIKPGVIPLNTALPAIGLMKISQSRRNTVAMTNTNPLRTERVQVTSMAKTYSLRDAILELVLNACPNQLGTINGFHVESIVPDGQGPDFEDTAAVIYEGSQDFIVLWRNVA